MSRTLRERTESLLAEFSADNYPDNFYIMTDGGEGLGYAEQMAALLREWADTGT